MENKPPLFVCSLSGGKDSTAMLLRLLEEKRPVDMILFCDTGLEFPAMYTHLEKLERETGRQITRIKAEHSYEYLMFDAPVRRGQDSPIVRRYGAGSLGYGWPGPRQRWCTTRLKDMPREKFLRSLREKYDIRQYVGIASDEKYRLERKNNQRSECIHPLVEWAMTEADCLAYCKERGYDWSGLYEKFSRVSCWCCPLQSLADLRVLYRDFPDLWAQLKRWDAMTWRSFKENYSVAQLEQRFDFEDEWLKAGNRLGTKAFYSALKQRLSEISS